MDNAKTESAVKNRFIVTVAAFSLLGVGFLSGMIVDRIRFDEVRSGLLARLDEDSHRMHERLMAIDREGSREGSAMRAKEN